MSAARIYLGRGPNEPPSSREEAELRVLRALATERQPDIVRSVALGVARSWPIYTHDDEEMQAIIERREQEEREMTHLDVFEPDLRDRTDWDTALMWFGAINPPSQWHNGRELWSYNRTQKIIRLRSFGLQQSRQPSWEWIADAMRLRSRYMAKQEYEHGIDGIWRAARGKDWNRPQRA